MNGFLQSLRRVETTDVDEIWLSGETSLREECMDPIAIDDEFWQKTRELD